MSRAGRARPSNTALVEACRRGDAAAWEALVARYQRLVYSVPRRFGLCEELAADVFVRVFATLIEQLDQIDQPAQIREWLMAAALCETRRAGSRAAGQDRLPMADSAGVSP